jgi:hypothetical protein
MVTGDNSSAAAKQAGPQHPAYQSVYSGASVPVAWDCRLIVDGNAARAYLSSRVRARLEDTADIQAFEADCLSLAPTGMARETIQKLLCSMPDRLDWEVGEAFAECLLEDVEGATLPWNKERDKRTPKASLPGADVVGFVEVGAETLLAIGEVKTSHDAATPPNVMNGRSGVIYQLESLADDRAKHFCILRGLRHRAIQAGCHDKWQKATAKYLSSGGVDVFLFGILMRDQTPNALDVSGRASKLASLLTPSAQAQLIAWYLPDSITTWPLLVKGVTQ